MECLTVTTFPRERSLGPPPAPPSRSGGNSQRPSINPVPPRRRIRSRPFLETRATVVRSVTGARTVRCGGIEVSIPAAGRAQIPRPLVVAEAGPGREECRERGPRQRPERREAPQETPVVGDDGPDGRLLKHHLGDPDPVRIPGAPPRKVPAVAPVPAHERADEGAGDDGDHPPDYNGRMPDETKVTAPLSVGRHPRAYRENHYVYPVLSRRARGVSIGINLNPDKICNWDCVYCQVDRTTPAAIPQVDEPRL